MKVKFVANKTDHLENRWFLIVGDLNKDIFARARQNPLTSSFLEQSSGRLQEALSGWYSSEQVLYTKFLRHAFGFDISSLQTKNRSPTQRE